MPSPDKPGDKPENFDQRLKDLRNMRGGMPQTYNLAVNAIRSALKGTDLNNMREMRENYYRGWKDIDLEDLLSLLGETK
jgi:hypothetical protein